MSYIVEIIFGKEQVIKYSQGESLSDYENLIHKKSMNLKLQRSETISTKDYKKLVAGQNFK